MTTCHYILNKYEKSKECDEMPSPLYYNLSDSKKEKLINSAKLEFSRVLLSDASINKIVKEAGISRGSFYLYFESKEELYSYILKEYRLQILRELYQIIEQHHGDLFFSFDQFFKSFIQYCFDNEEKNFFKNSFLNSNMYIESKVIYHPKDSESEQVLEKIKEKIDLSKLSVHAKENLDITLLFLFDITLKNIMPVLLWNQSKQKAYQHFLKSLELLKGGISR